MTEARVARRRRHLLLVFAMVSVLVLAPGAEAKEKRKDGTSKAFSSCVRGISPYGAYIELAARTSVNWKNASHAIVDFAHNESEVRDCGPRGNLIGGGRLSFTTVVEFTGDQLEGCSAGFPSGVSCEFNPDHTQATYTFKHGPINNESGRGSLKVGGMDVNTGNTGHVYSVKFTTSTTLSEGANSAQTQTTIDLHF